jgi:hypothetical protein
LGVLVVPVARLVFGLQKMLCKKAPAYVT